MLSLKRYMFGGKRKTNKRNRKTKTKKITTKTLNNLLRPYIFTNPLKTDILTNSKQIGPKEYGDLSLKLFNSNNGKVYKRESDKIIKNAKNGLGKLILYMNFKSHNILNKEKRAKLYNIISKYNPDIICLSEALLPVSIKNNKLASGKATVVEISGIKDDTISQPYKAATEFAIKKKADYGEDGMNVKGGWKSFFIGEGYKYIVFGNPSECPWGENWGNCIITKMKPDDAYVLQMKSYGKKSFNEPESRCLVSIKIGDELICTTHLENRIAESRQKQTKEIINFLKKQKKNFKKITLVADLNAVNKESYTKEELKILKLLNFGQIPVPSDSVDIINNSGLIGSKPINTGQKYESLFQKCVSHCYSTTYKKSCMVFTDATDFDHQAICVW